MTVPPTSGTGMDLYEREIGWVELNVSPTYGRKKVADVLEPVFRRHLERLSQEIHEFFPDALVHDGEGEPHA